MSAADDDDPPAARFKVGDVVWVDRCWPEAWTVTNLWIGCRVMYALTQGHRVEMSLPADDVYATEAEVIRAMLPAEERRLRETRDRAAAKEDDIQKLRARLAVLEAAAPNAAPDAVPAVPPASPETDP